MSVFLRGCILGDFPQLYPYQFHFQFYFTLYRMSGFLPPLKQPQLLYRKIKGGAEEEASAPFQNVAFYFLPSSFPSSWFPTPKERVCEPPSERNYIPSVLNPRPSMPKDCIFQLAQFSPVHQPLTCTESLSSSFKPLIPSKQSFPNCMPFSVH